MKCSKCSDKAVFQNPNLCKKHFIAYFENKVKNTIKKYKLLTKKDKIVVACSGGKDSISVLYLVKKFVKDPVAIAIDEGIKGYRSKTLEDLKEFCKQNKIKLKIYSYEDYFGASLDKMKKLTHLIPCTICGTFRRYMLNKYSKEYTKIVTGHNLDDEAQSIFMNLLKNNLEISARLGPETGLIKDKRFTPRVKPLYFCTEKETIAYSLLMGFPVTYTECPYSSLSHRMFIRDSLNSYENKRPGFKQTLIDGFIKTLPKLKKHFKTKVTTNSCEECGGVSDNKICMTCKLSKEIKNKSLYKNKHNLNT
ncbi:TIGR00269 family protein [Candidatus Woesearchaeota archaeon]|nr:TIGR00269 family protein [Candidatus Woesearchaeota archaeon]